MKCKRFTTRVGDYTLTKTIGETRGIVRWSGEGNLGEGLHANGIFTEWTDELFGKYCDKAMKTAYKDAWNQAISSMFAGRVVDVKLTDKDGQIRVKIHHDEDVTWVKFFKKETEEG